jgi:hypothetical protein
MTGGGQAEFEAQREGLVDPQFKLRRREPKVLLPEGGIASGLLAHRLGRT